MTPEYFFNQLRLPAAWRYKGLNHTRNDDEKITIFGKVYDDGKSKNIRICFAVHAERCMIVERTRPANGIGCRYKTVCNIRAEEIDRINEFIVKQYIL